MYLYLSEKVWLIEVADFLHIFWRQVIPVLLVTCESPMYQEKQRKAIMESLLAAERYCVLTTCRRKFLLEYFGEKFPADRCGLPFT